MMRQYAVSSSHFPVKRPKESVAFQEKIDLDVAFEYLFVGLLAVALIFQ